MTFAYVLTAKVSNMLLTAYCACIVCCGHTHGITKSGRPARVGITVACQGDMLNKKVYIEGLGIRTCDDTGSKITEDRIDVYFTSHKEALKFGVKRAKVFHFSIAKRRK